MVKPRHHSHNPDILYKDEAAVWFAPSSVRPDGENPTPIVGVNDSWNIRAWLVQHPGDDLLQLWALKWIRSDGTRVKLLYEWG